MPDSYESLPDDLPVPVDDGGCDHLLNLKLPDLLLKSTSGEKVNLASKGSRVVLYCYPMTGVPGIALPDGWDDIPGARGCTPQSLAYREHHDEIEALGAEVFGISTQSTDYQNDMVRRLGLPYQVLSDHQLEFASALSIPTFSVEGNTLMKRVTLIANDGLIEAVHYPIFPSDTDPRWVIQFLTNNPL
ncbi:MAG: peroxiredoxin [Gammaproteobacteria bacterium]|nr:peroxiredoxin [Gammaproteobacteria bacterium]MYD77350.1 peroxiredoxin [Gammaproteobacteria bacterium]MYI89928.1 peroxiredoxin [Gammaproteobacteria bacterium]